MDKRGGPGDFVDIVDNVENVDFVKNVDNVDFVDNVDNVDFVENVDNVASLAFPDNWIRNVVQVQQHVLKPGRRNTRSSSGGGFRRGRLNKIAAWA